MVKALETPKLVSLHLCCALSLSSFIHASASLLKWNETSTVALQLELTWLRELSQSWPVATQLADKVEYLASSFQLFTDPGTYETSIDSSSQGQSRGESAGIEACQLSILAAAPDFGLRM